jgi:F0F1-type ATP synthase epsilon subunit
VLEGHIPLLSALKPGVVRISVEQKRTQLAIGSGFAEVGAGDRVLVTTSRHAFPDDIDVEEVRHELSEAEDAIKLWSGEVHELDPETDQWKETADYKALRRKVEWAQARLEATR